MADTMIRAEGNYLTRWTDALLLCDKLVTTETNSRVLME